MKVVIVDKVVSLSQVKPVCDRFAEGFSFMEGDSPVFPSVGDLLDWYKILLPAERFKYISYIKGKGYLFVYVHQVAREEFTCDHGYKARKGEILSTDEYCIYSFSKQKWVTDLD